MLERCPLGTAAGYGVNVPLDRDGVAETLGFSGIQVNPMASQASRGKLEVQVLASLWQVAQTIRRLAWDLTVFATSEFGFVQIPDAMSTGSSIMPNKRNPDVPELLRGTAGVIAGAMAEVQQIISLPSGYHRDLQLTKGPLVRATQVAISSIELVPALISGLELNRERMAAAIDKAMFAADAATELALEGLPFRDAYRKLAEEGVESGNRTAAQSIDARTSPGGCADLRLRAIGDRLG
jgi:argininosuccinate lyase